MKNLLLLIFLLLSANSAFADWILDNERSHLHYLSTKVVQGAQNSATELNEFQKLSGKITERGLGTLEIELDSVETLIPIRNERLRKFVFKTDLNPTATVNVTVDMASVRALFRGENRHLETEASISIGGITQTVKETLNVAKTRDGSIYVATTKPILLDGKAFELNDGFLKLTELAKLLYIPTTIPVSFELFYQKN